MPGSVSDSYDPEFTTGANADIVRSGIRGVLDKLAPLGPPMDLADILRHDDVQEAPNPGLTERDLRIIRFCLHRVDGLAEADPAAHAVRNAIGKLALLGERRYIVTVCESEDRTEAPDFGLTARDLLVARFCLSLAEESI